MLNRCWQKIFRKGFDGRLDLMRERHPGQLKARDPGLRPKTQEDDLRISNCTGARTQGFAAALSPGGPGYFRHH